MCSVVKLNSSLLWAVFEQLNKTSPQSTTLRSTAGGPALECSLIPRVDLMIQLRNNVTLHTSVSLQYSLTIVNVRVVQHFLKAYHVLKEYIGVYESPIF
jgi:hypothetical protein